MKKYLEIVDAKDAGNLRVLLTFNDGVQQTVDIGDFIRRNPDPQWNRYLDPKKFATFTIVNGNVVWGADWDLIFPLDQLHQGVISD